jgi:hypothetical protein
MVIGALASCGPARVAELVAAIGDRLVCVRECRGGLLAAAGRSGRYVLLLTEEAPELDVEWVARADLDWVLALAGLPEPGYFAGTPHARHAVVVPYHLPPFASFELRSVDLAALWTRLADLSVVRIADTPHARYLRGEVDQYARYYERHVGREICDDHTTAKFERMRLAFDYPHAVDGRRAYILVTSSGERLMVLDGNHRAALLMHAGTREATVAVVSTEF